MGNPTVFFEVAGPDQKGLIDFYTQLFGWKTSDVPGEMPYSLVAPGEGGAAGGIGPTPDGSQGHVTFYVGVDDVGAALDKAESLGGSKIMGPMEVPGGNIGLFTDPEGHVIGVWSGTMEGNGGAGSPVVWFEVIGKDADRLRSFYGDLFGWNFDVMQEMDYGMVSADANGGGISGGIGGAPEGMDASYQTVYAGVDDVDGALSKAESLGGKTVMPPRDLPMGGRIALFVDPQGHTFGLFRPPPEQ